MSSVIEPDRIGKIFADSGRVDSFSEADALLQSFAVSVHVGDTPDYLQQLFLYSFVNIAHRCFRGGIYVSGNLAATNRVPILAGGTISEACRSLGAITDRAAPDGSPLLAVGGSSPPATDPTTTFYASFGHWWGGVYREPPEPASSGSALGAVLSAGLVTAALFTFFDRDRAPHCVQSQYLCLWSDRAGFGTPDSDGPALSYLPNDLWLMGLGHLGQAYAWLIGLLPYPAGHDGRVVVQDNQRLSAENYGTSALYFDRSETMKTDVVRVWLENRGFNVFRIERRVGPRFRREAADPSIGLAGFDHSAPRRWTSDAGFDLIIDGGVGASVRSFSNIRVTTLPGPDTAAELWPDRPDVGGVPSTPAYKALETGGSDPCGIAQIAGRAVAAPFVGMVTACAVVAQLLRPLHSRPPLHRWSYDVRSPASLHSLVNLNNTIRVLSIPFCETCPD